MVGLGPTGQLKMASVVGKCFKRCDIDRNGRISKKEFP